MEIISHRGYWNKSEEKNTLKAFENSLLAGFGTETDFRDRDENIVISHDMATIDSMKAGSFFKVYRNTQYTLALNIKADGLQSKLKLLLQAFGINNYFVFDMSIPDTLGYIKEGIRFFSRQSEYELQPAFYNECAGIWLDAFTGEWFDASLVKDHVAEGKKVAIVSPELHKREPGHLWEKIKKNNIHLLDEVILCTDIPSAASGFFK